MRNTEILPSDAALAGRAAEIIVAAAKDAVAERGRFTLALTGGSGPKQTYELLASLSAEKIDWSRVLIFLGDERFVPYDDPSSNYGMCRRLLLDHVPIPPGSLHPIPTDAPTPAEAAALYAATLARVLGRPPGGPPPALDLILLGMGDDGHCASLFPGKPTLAVEDAWVVSTPPGTLPPPIDRVTLTFPALNAARQVLFLINGERKAAAVRDILERGAGIDVHPSAGVAPASGGLTWLLDQSAASLLSK